MASTCSDASPFEPEQTANNLEDCPVRVLCLSVYPREGPSVRHRIEVYREAFAAAGVTLHLWPLLTSGLFRRRRRFGRIAALVKFCEFVLCTLRLAARLPWVMRYDSVIIHREAYPVGPPVIEQLVLRLCPRVFYDVDDAVWERMPLRIDQRGRWHDPGRFEKIMRGSEVVVVGNDYLRAFAQKFNPRTRIIPTSYRDLGGRAQRLTRRARPVILWIGNVGNEEYLGILHEPLRRLAREHAFLFMLVGSAEARGYTIEGVDIEVREWSEASEGDLLLSADIGIMPLPDRPYERGKCAFKIVQYFSAGLAVVASPVGMNVEIITHGRNGCLADDADAWYACLARLLSDRAYRCDLGDAGYETYRQGFTPGVNAEKWLSILTERA
ncbi:MAG: glycosyltransferase family 4 protein [Gammaproteobacteria bacterium]